MSIISTPPSSQPRPAPRTHTHTHRSARIGRRQRVLRGGARPRPVAQSPGACCVYTELPRAPANRRETDRHALAQRGRGLQRAAHAEPFHHRLRFQDGHHAVDDPQDGHRHPAPRSRELQLGDRTVGRLVRPVMCCCLPLLQQQQQPHRYTEQPPSSGQGLPPPLPAPPTPHSPPRMARCSTMQPLLVRN